MSAPDEEQLRSKLFYSPLWDDLVTGNEEAPDIEGLVAYAIYKQTKRSWHRQFVDHYGRTPTFEEVNNYVRSITPEDRKRYRREASDLLTVHAGAIIEAARPRIEQTAVDQSILAEVRRQNSFWRNLGVSLLASAVLAVILFLMGVVFLAPSPQEIGRGVSGILGHAP